MSNLGDGYIRIPFEVELPEIEGEELERPIYWLEQALIEKVNNLVGDSLRTPCAPARRRSTGRSTRPRPA